MMRYLKLGLLSLLFLAAAETQAASLYIDPAFSEMNRGDAKQLAVRLDVDEEAGECVNAVDAVISYSENISVVDISTGDSILTVWVEEPVINKEDRTITFAGGLPNGYCGRVQGDPRLTNNLIKIIVRAPGFSVGRAAEGSAVASVRFEPQTAAYLNDGRGTSAQLNTFGAEIAVSDNAGNEIVDTWRAEVAADTIRPEEFSISLEQNDTAFGGKYFIVFNTTDKQTGIDLYQVMEEPLSSFGYFNWGRADAPWITARSPYVLEDQSLNSTIRVRAIDKAGNEYVATLLPSDELRKTSVATIVTVVTILLVVGILVAAGFVAMRIFKRRRTGFTEEGGINKTDDE